MLTFGRELFAFSWLYFDVGCLPILAEERFNVATWPSLIPPQVQVLLQDGITHIFATAEAYAAILVDGQVLTWGSSEAGGNSSAVEGNLSSNATKIFSTIDAFAALKVGGQVVTWGYPEGGGDSSAVEAQLSGNVTEIFSANHAFAALKVGGQVVTWGYSNDGGDSSTVEDKLSSNVTKIFSSYSAFAALKVRGQVVTWGDPNYGGDSSAVEDKLSSNVIKIFNTHYAFAALKVGGQVVTWGSGDDGGDSSAMEDELSSNVTEIFSTYHAFAALKVGGQVVTWGNIKYGGDSSAVEAELSSNVTNIFSTIDAFAALKVGGQVVTWGYSADGGDSSAVEAELSSKVTKIFSTSNAFAALKVGGQVVTWGYGDDGGDSSAVEAELSSNVTDIFSTYYAFAALKIGGQVVTWGSPNYGGDSSVLTAILSSRVASVIGFTDSFAALVCIPRRTMENEVAFCELCSHNQVWNGILLRCQECERPDIEVPNTEQSSCTTCEAGYSPNLNKSKCSSCFGNTFAPAASAHCKECPIGRVSHENKSSCERCSEGLIAEEGICKPMNFEGICSADPNESPSACTVDLEQVAWAAIYMTLVIILAKMLVQMFCRKFVVIDVSLNHGKAILTTLTQHNLSSPSFRRSFPVKLYDTCHPGLDTSNYSKPKVARAKVVDSHRLELLDVNRDSVNERFDTSKGTLSLMYRDSCLHASLMSTPLMVPSSLISVVIIGIAVLRFEAAEGVILTLAAALSSCVWFASMNRRKLRNRTPLQKELDRFRDWLGNANPNPTACPKGPGRAIRLDKLLKTYEVFQGFILDRTAYYLDGNILKPLTAKYRLSYAEVVGPEHVDFFVSHFWGTQFSHFCASLQKHAEAVVAGTRDSFTRHETLQTLMQHQPNESAAHRHHVAYWVCFCSNNQYDIQNELGGDNGLQESSFYLALLSPKCKAVCMMLDDRAMPLTRSWCIFETLQALKLTQSRPDFQFLMITASGVLNHGNSSIEAAMGVVRRVSLMDVRMAQACNQADKDMIDDLVLKEMGTFDELNNFIASGIHTILQKAQERCASEFENLFNVLAMSRQKWQTSKSSSALAISQTSNANEELKQLERSHTKQSELLEIWKQLELIIPENSEMSDALQRLKELSKQPVQIKDVIQL